MRTGACACAIAPFAFGFFFTHFLHQFFSHRFFSHQFFLHQFAHAEYSLDAGPWQFVEPVGGLSDSKQEHYDFLLRGESLDGKAGEHLVTVRVFDRHDNVGVAKTVFTVPAK